MKKKYILLIIRRSVAEVDWILPLIYNLKKKFKILTIFNSPQAFESLKRNTELYILWKDVVEKYFVYNKSNFFFLRLLYFGKRLIYNKSNKKPSLFSRNFINKELSLKSIDEVKYVFHDFGGETGLLNAFHETDTKIVFFPHSSILWKNRVSKPHYSLNGQILLLGNQIDKKRWRPFFKNKMIVTGHLKYKKEWIQKILRVNKHDNFFSIKEIKIFTIIMKDFNNYSEKEKIRTILSEVIDAIKLSFKNYKIIFKLAPKNYDENISFLNDIKTKMKINFEFSNLHILKLAKYSDYIFVIPPSAVPIDTMSLGKMSIELWNSKENSKFSYSIKSQKSLMNFFNLKKKDLLKLEKKKKNLFKKMYHFNILGKKKLETIFR